MGKPFKFLWVQAGDHSDIEKKFNLAFGFPAMVIINKNKSLFSVLKGAFSKEGISKFLDGILIGKF